MYFSATSFFQLQQFTENFFQFIKHSFTSSLKFFLLYCIQLYEYTIIYMNNLLLRNISLFTVFHYDRQGYNENHRFMLA